MPQVLAVVAAVVDEFHVLAPGDGLGVDLELRHFDLEHARSCANAKPASATPSSQAVAGMRSGSRSTAAGSCSMPSGKPSVWAITTSCSPRKSSWNSASR